MANDTIESIAVIPNRTDNFDEVWMVVNRENGRFIERMVSRTVPTLCEGDNVFRIQDQTRLDSSVIFNTSIDVEAVTLGAATTITASSHGLSDNDEILIDCIEGTTELNDTTYKVTNAATDSFELNNTSDVAIDSSAYTAYIDGGFIREKNTVFSGLDHLSGEMVGILADGEVLTNVTLTSSTTTLTSSAALVHIGIPYYSDLETLDVDFQKDDGTSQGIKLKIGNIMYRFVESKGGYLGPDEDNLYEAFTDLFVSYNSSELIFVPSDYTFNGQDISSVTPYLYTGDLRRPLKGGFKKGGRSFFRQIDSTPVTITAIVPEIDAGGPK